MVYAVAGFAVEQLGVHTGLPFGYYRYLGLGPHVFGVPPLVAVAWAVLLAYTSQMLTPLSLPRAGKAAIGAAWMVLFDLAIDPLAAGPLKSWVWLQPGGYYGVPWGNFLGWFLLSFGLLYCTRPLPAKECLGGLHRRQHRRQRAARLPAPGLSRGGAGQRRVAGPASRLPRIAALRQRAGTPTAPAKPRSVELNIYRAPDNP